MVFNILDKCLCCSPTQPSFSNRVRVLNSTHPITQLLLGTDLGGLNPFCFHCFTAPIAPQKLEANRVRVLNSTHPIACLLYTSDAADE